MARSAEASRVTDDSSHCLRGIASLTLTGELSAPSILSRSSLSAISVPRSPDRVTSPRRQEPNKPVASQVGA